MSEAQPIWTEPRTWRFRDKVTAAALNVDLRDNLLLLKNSLGAIHIVETGAVADGATSAVGATRDALEQSDSVIISGGDYFFDNQVDVLGKHLHIAADARLIVANGYTGTVLRLLGDDAQESGSFQQGRPAITGRGVIVEEGTPARNWTGIEVFADGNDGTDFVSMGGIGPVLIDHVGTGLLLHANDLSGGNGFITGMTMSPRIDHCVVGVEERETDGGTIARNTYFKTLVQTRSMTTHGFKDIVGRQESFIDCMAWDYGQTGAVPMRIALDAVETQIDGGNLRVEDVEDNGSRTYFTGRPRLTDDGLGLNNPPGNWPTGSSVMYASANNTGATPNGGDGVVVPFRAGDAAHQQFFPHSDAEDFLWARSYNLSANAWLPWNQTLVITSLVDDRTGDQGPDAYPSGLSLMRLSGAFTSDGANNWDVTDTSALVQTVKANNDDFAQQWLHEVSGGRRSFWRVRETASAWSGWREAAQIRSGGTTGRPSASSVSIGTEYFDTDLASGAGKPVWSNGTDWVDATGAVA